MPDVDRGDARRGLPAESLKISSWEKAEQIRREMEEGKGVRHVPISEAIETFIAEQKARALTESTLRKLRTLTAALAGFCEAKSIVNISQLNIDRVRQFRASWKDSSISAHKKLERTRSFSKFCLDSGWMKDNPAKPLKSPIVTDPPTLPFSDDEVTRIIKHATGKWRTLVCCAAQMFLDSGDGVIFKGAFGPWYSPDTGDFHLSYQAARDIAELAITSYKKKVFLYQSALTSDKPDYPHRSRPAPHEQQGP